MSVERTLTSGLNKPKQIVLQKLREVRANENTIRTRCSYRCWIHFCFSAKVIRSKSSLVVIKYFYCSEFIRNRKQNYWKKKKIKTTVKLPSDNFERNNINKSVTSVKNVVRKCKYFIVIVFTLWMEGAANSRNSRARFVPFKKIIHRLFVTLQCFREFVSNSFFKEKNNIIFLI